MQGVGKQEHKKNRNCGSNRRKKQDREETIKWGADYGRRWLDCNSLQREKGRERSGTEGAGEEYTVTGKVSRVK